MQACGRSDGSSPLVCHQSGGLMLRPGYRKEHGDVKTFILLLSMVAWAYFLPDHFVFFWGKFIANSVEVVSGIVEVYKMNRS